MATILTPNGRLAPLIVNEFSKTPTLTRNLFKNLGDIDRLPTLSFFNF